MIITWILWDKATSEKTADVRQKVDFYVLKLKANTILSIVIIDCLEHHIWQEPPTFLQYTSQHVRLEGKLKEETKCMKLF